MKAGSLIETTEYCEKNEEALCPDVGWFLTLAKIINLRRKTGFLFWNMLGPVYHITLTRQETQVAIPREKNRNKWQLLSTLQVDQGCNGKDNTEERPPVIPDSARNTGSLSSSENEPFLLPSSLRNWKPN